MRQKFARSRARSCQRTKRRSLRLLVEVLEPRRLLSAEAFHLIPSIGSCRVDPPESALSSSSPVAPATFYSQSAQRDFGIPDARPARALTAAGSVDTSLDSFGTSAAAPHAAAVAALFEPIQTDSGSQALLHDLIEDPVGTWIPQGPFSATNGQVEKILGRPVTGAIHAVLAHPTDPDVLWIGATNGGVWKTDNATDPSPTWQPLTDGASSQSIGALAFDSADLTYQTVYAGNGRYSSFSRVGTGRDGLLRTTDGGASWQRIGAADLEGANISGIVANGDNIVVSVNIADMYTFGNIGIFRSVDGGITFNQVSSGTGSATGLPGGSSYDLFADPTNPDIMYTSTVFSDLIGGTNGVFKSTDAGASWTRVSNPSMDSLITNNTSNIEIAVGTSNNVYVAIINAGRLDGLFRSGNGGSDWVQMDTPSTNENGTDVGLNPRGSKGPLEGTPEEIAGGQGSIHFSILADPTDPHIVYVGGDRQPRSDGDTGSFPNSIGARDYSGRLFRGDASVPSGSQFVHLTHSNELGADGGGTASSSAPHADSREMVFDASGDLIQVDDGGVYRRTAPRSDSGDWFSVIGDLQVTEIHDIAYDHVQNVLISGNQDTGTTQQSSAGDAVWTSIHTGDGGDVAVDEITLAASNQTIRYSSFQSLGWLRRRTYDAAGNLVSQVFPGLTVAGGGAPLDPAFRTPVELNAVDPTQLIVQGRNSTYESSDQAETLVEIGPGVGVAGIRQNAIAYGGSKDGVPNEDVLWVGSGNSVYLRPASGAPLAPTPSAPGSSTIFDLTIDPADWETAAVIDEDQLFFTQDAGASWTDFTGNLSSSDLSFSSLAYVSGIVDALILGTSRGVFASAIHAMGTWTPLGTDLPTALVYDMEYDAVDDVLAVGTLGRGAWLLGEVSDLVQQAFAPATIAGRHVFYNASVFDGAGAGVDGINDSAAIATDKSALLPGETASFANYTSYSRGINGIMVDIADLPGVVSASDFEFRVGNDDDPSGWETATPPTALAVLPGAGADGSDRIVITWTDGAIAKTWLQVTVKANANTGLLSPDVHYWGNWTGETGNSANDTIVNTFDQLLTRINFTSSTSSAEVDSAYDFDRDGKVNTFDQLLARINFTSSTNYLRLISPPLSAGLNTMAETESDVDPYGMYVDSLFAEDDEEESWEWLYQFV